MANKFSALRGVLVLGFAVSTLVACGGGNNVDPEDIAENFADGIVDSAQQLGMDTGVRDVASEGGSNGDSATSLVLDEDPQPRPQGIILSDPVTFDPIELFPGIVELQQHETSGLLLGYTDASQIGDPDLEYVNDAWLSMQECLRITADAPLVVLQHDSVEPLASTDDIVFDFQGRISASANDGDSGASLQVMASEVAETFVQRGFSLRSIIGRYLWRNNSLPERDYPFSCASGS